MNVSVIIINWNRGSDTCEAIDSVLSQDYVSIEIIVVDNGSTDDSLELIKKKYPSINVLSLPSNIGCPSGRNVGAREAKGELLFFLEDDGFYMESDLISGTVQKFKDNPQLGAAYFKVLDFKTRIPDAPLGRPRSYANKTFISSYFRGGASVIRRQVFEMAGFYPDDFFRQAEERYLSYCIYKLGYYILYFPRYTMCHKEVEYTNKGKVIAVYELRNSLLTAIRLYPLRYMFIDVLYKLVNNFKFMYSCGAVGDYFKILRQVPGWIFKRNSGNILTVDQYRTVESLKYFHVDRPEDISKVGEKYSLKNILSIKLNGIKICK